MLAAGYGSSRSSIDRRPTPAPTCCRASAPGSACRRAPCPCRSVCCERLPRVAVQAPGRAASPGRTGARLPSRSPRPACRNASATARRDPSKPSSRAPSFASSTKRCVLWRIGSRDRVPAGPRVGELVVVAAVRDDVGELVDPCSESGSRAGSTCPSPYMASSFEVMRCELGALGGVGRCGRATPSLSSWSERARVADSS